MHFQTCIVQLFSIRIHCRGSWSAYQVCSVGATDDETMADINLRIAMIKDVFGDVLCRLAASVSASGSGRPDPTLDGG